MRRDGDARDEAVRVVDFYWRCATCLCRYLESQARVVVPPYPACPNCGEEEDVFRADDGEWGPDKDGRTPALWDWDGVKRDPHEAVKLP